MWEGRSQQRLVIGHLADPDEGLCKRHGAIYLSSMRDTLGLSGVVLFGLLFSSCNRMMVGLIGLHPYDHHVTEKKVDRLAQRMGIAPAEDLALTRRYSYRMEERRGHEPEDHWKAKFQPLQLRWYSKGGRAQWIIPNCDVGGFPNLQWSRFGLPDTLFVGPPSRAYADSAWTVWDDINFMLDRRTKAAVPDIGPSDGYLLVYWSYFMGRQSKRLVQNVEEWRLKNGKGITVRYVNADPLMMGVDPTGSEGG